MKHILVVLTLLFSMGIAAQEQHEDGTWWDNNLEFAIQTDLLKKFGELEICIYDSKRELCIENLMTTYELLIYNVQGDEIWNSLWSGKDMEMVFKKEFPSAHHIIIKATKPFVINKLTGTRIYQDKPMELKYTLQ